jgi:FixJ family two-component response regulator
VRFLLESVGWQVAEHANGRAFLEQYRESTAGCALIDVRMPGMSGLELLRELRRRGHALPVIFLTGHGDVALAVQAMKDGALDFLQKPYRDQSLLDSIELAVRESESVLALAAQQRALGALYAQLTPRECEVAQLVASGLPNKRIAQHLSISEKTVHVHRANVLAKMQAGSAAELANQLAILRVEPDGASSPSPSAP